VYVLFLNFHSPSYFYKKTTLFLTASLTVWKESFFSLGLLSPPLFTLRTVKCDQLAFIIHDPPVMPHRVKRNASRQYFIFSLLSKLHYGNTMIFHCKKKSVIPQLALSNGLPLPHNSMMYGYLHNSQICTKLRQSNSWNLIIIISLSHNYVLLL
jgi:hypothetical protein